MGAGGEVIRVMTGWSGGKGALTRLTKILRTPLAVVTIVVMTVTAVSDRDTCLQN